MGDAPAPAGTTVLRPLPDRDTLNKAIHYLDMMLFDVRTRPKGFDYGGVTALVGNFLQFVKIFRGRGEIGAMHHMWTRRQTLRPTPHGRKRSEHIVFTVKSLKSMLEVQGTPGLHLIYDLYGELQKSMFELVSEFRDKMKDSGHKDLDKFTRELDRVTTFHKTSQW